MNRWWLALSVGVFLIAAQSASAQTQPPNPALPAGPQPGVPELPQPAPPTPAPATGTGAVNPYFANPTGAYASNPANYRTTPEGARHRASPQQQSAERQSGLNEAQAKTLLEGKGYRQVGAVRADPNSLWVWQADAIKDGRPVRVGIDYRGEVLDLSSSQAKPCTLPGVQPGAVGSLAVGSRLAQADSCASR